MSAEPQDSGFVTTLVSFLLGGVASFVATLVAERLKRPSLVFEIADPRDLDYSKGKPRPVQKARFLHLQIRNRELLIGLRWLGRSAAMYCSGKIEFRNRSGDPVFSTSMPLRWTGTPEPVPMQIQIGGATGFIFDHFRHHLEQKVDIPAGEARLLDVAAQFDSDQECYGWSNESYSSQPQWRNPGRKLDPGEYVVDVTVNHLGGRDVFSCELVNQGGKFYLKKKA